MMNWEELGLHLEHNTRVLDNRPVREAFQCIDRQDFLPDLYKVEAYEDYAVPIGHGEELLKPTLALFMLELLDTMPGDRVLEIGSGSGWVTALLAKITGSEGSVVGTEFEKELVDRGNAALKKYDIANARIEVAGKAAGAPDRAPFDRILVAKSVIRIPKGLREQLSAGGIMVIPLNDVITKIVKKQKFKVEREVHGFTFEQLKNSNAEL